MGPPLAAPRIAGSAGSVVTPLIPADPRYLLFQSVINSAVKSLVFNLFSAYIFMQTTLVAGILSLWRFHTLKSLLHVVHLRFTAIRRTSVSSSSCYRLDLTSYVVDIYKLSSHSCF